MPAAREMIVSAIVSVYMFIGVDDEPFATVVHVFTVVGVDVGLWETVPTAAVVVVATARSVYVVA